MKLLKTWKSKYKELLIELNDNEKELDKTISLKNQEIKKNELLEKQIDELTTELIKLRLENKQLKKGKTNEKTVRRTKNKSI